MIRNRTSFPWLPVAGCKAVTLVSSLLFVGCSTGPSRIAGVQIDVDRAASRIMAQYDKNHDGDLSQDELDAVPAIDINRRWYDGDNDGRISELELGNGLRAIFNPKDGLLSVACEVTRNGQPLSGANVKFVPLPELDGVIPPASGVTDSNGATMLNLADGDRPPHTPPRIPVARPGLYLVEVTHDQIKIPEEYNSKTKLGKEVSGYSTLSGPLKIRLKF